MTPEQAEKIVQQFGLVIAEGKPVKRLSDLPCSKAKLKRAFFTYLPAVYETQGNFPKQETESLVIVYAMLNGFVDDEEADKLEAIKAKMDSGKLDYDKKADKTLVSQFLAYQASAMQDSELFDEINKYIQEIMDYPKQG
jgi:hypothetical protein